jgi:hypothetical protein
MTYAEPPGSWLSRNEAVASADVQIADSRHVQTRSRQAGGEVAWREDRVVGQHQEATLLIDEPLQELSGSGQGMLFTHQHPVHVGQPALSG